MCWCCCIRYHRRVTPTQQHYSLTQNEQYAKCRLDCTVSHTLLHASYLNITHTRTHTHTHTHARARARARTHTHTSPPHPHPNVDTWALNPFNQPTTLWPQIFTAPAPLRLGLSPSDDGGRAVHRWLHLPHLHTGCSDPTDCARNTAGGPVSEPRCRRGHSRAVADHQRQH